MKLAPIQLLQYFLTEFHLSTNPKFERKQKPQLRYNDFQITIEANFKQEDKRDWQLTLKLQYQPAAEANVPYRLSAEIIGFLVVHPTYREDLIERLIRTNGASMLFGALREIIRDATARGPYPPLIIPSTSFYEPSKKSEEPNTTSAPGTTQPPAAPE